MSTTLLDTSPSSGATRRRKEAATKHQSNPLAKDVDFAAMGMVLIVTYLSSKSSKDYVKN